MAPAELLMRAPFDLQTGPVRLQDPLFHDPLRRHLGCERSPVGRVVRIGLEKEGRPRSEAPVDEAFQPADFQVIAPKGGFQAQAQEEIDFIDRHVDAQPRGQLSGFVELLIRHKARRKI